MPVTVTILRFTRLLLLLVFGSRPSDQTEGTFVGIGDATNMAVIPQGLNEFSWKCSIRPFDLFHIKSSHDMVILLPAKDSKHLTSKFLNPLLKVTSVIGFAYDGNQWHNDRLPNVPLSVLWSILTGPIVVAKNKTKQKKLSSNVSLTFLH